MKVNGKQIRRNHIPFLPIFLISFFAGIVIMYIWKEALLFNTGLLDEYSLYHMKYMTLDKNALFFYVLSKRFKVVILTIILATTYLGLFFLLGLTIWYGTATGMVLAAVLIRYGLKGIFLILAGVFPQYLFYIPALVLLVSMCENLYQNIGMKKIMGDKALLHGSWTRYFLRYIILIFIVLLGCILESYLNPFIIKNLLKIF